MRPRKEQEPKPEHAEEKKELVEKEADKTEQLEELRRQLADLQKEKDELFARLQRLSADYANFQKRAPKQVADTIAYEKETLIKTLLPALDNFEHTFANAHAAENVDAVIKGVQIIYEQILNILKSHGIEQINALGQKFDPSQHEAVLRKTDPQQPDGTVMEEHQKGYTLNGRVIRASRVVVNKLPEEELAQQSEAEPEEQTANQDETVDEPETNERE